MNTLTLRLLINHLADIISTLEEQLEAANKQSHSKNRPFTRLQKSPFSETYTYKELLPLYGLMQTLEKSLPAEMGIGLDDSNVLAIQEQ